MDKELKTKWLTALRDGGFAQGEGLLKDSNASYCCLGVLATVKGCEWQGQDDHEIVPLFAGKEVGRASDPEAFLDADFAGVSYEDQKVLADMNDSGKPFPDIADWIEENL